MFFKNYKNPCFYRNVTYLGGKELKMPMLAIRCLPYFFIIGMPKSGTTDVWHGLEQHPGVAIRHGKEPMYFTRRRYPRGCGNEHFFLNVTFLKTWYECQ